MILAATPLCYKGRFYRRTRQTSADQGSTNDTAVSLTLDTTDNKYMDEGKNYTTKN